jgi:hypothetical protein
MHLDSRREATKRRKNRITRGFDGSSSSPLFDARGGRVDASPRFRK